MWLVMLHFQILYITLPKMSNNDRKENHSSEATVFPILALIINYVSLTSKVKVVIKVDTVHEFKH